MYKELTEATETTYDWIRASASMPLLSRIVELEGYRLLDGGIADSIPLQHFERLGYRRNVVILTQPQGYRKNHNKLMPLMRLFLRKYPNLIEALDQRHLMYNAQLDYVSEAEHAGRCLVIRPDAPLPIGHVSHDAAEMQRVYDMGRQKGLQQLETIKSFFSIHAN